jgi:uncharacterized protein (DUF3084 family)
MIDPTASDILGGGAIVTAGTYALHLLWRALARGRVDGAKDRAEIDIISTLREENKLLRERCEIAFKERNAAMQETAQLRSEVALLKRDIEQLEEQLSTLKSRLGSLSSRHWTPDES